MVASEDHVHGIENPGMKSGPRAKSIVCDEHSSVSMIPGPRAGKVQFLCLYKHLQEGLYMVRCVMYTTIHISTHQVPHHGSSQRIHVLALGIQSLLSLFKRRSY